MYDHTKLVQEQVWRELLAVLPTPRQHHYGRPRVAKEALVCGILQVLVNGVAWRKIADCGCSYASCFRYLQELQRRGTLKLIQRALAKVKTDLREGMIDTTTVTSFEFRAMTAWDGFNKTVGTKVSLFTDGKGLPADVGFGKGNREDKDFVADHIQHTRGQRKKRITFDMKYMSLVLRRQMRAKKIRVNMHWREQDYRRKRGPKFRFDADQYKIRFQLERTNGWLKSFRAIRLRRSYHSAMFKALVYLAVIVVLVRY